MQITVELPEDIAHHPANDRQGLSRAALEALAIEGVAPASFRCEHRALGSAGGATAVEETGGGVLRWIFVVKPWRSGRPQGTILTGHGTA
jgi:hypothetical protein